MLTDAQVFSEWKRRREATWRATIVPYLVAITASIAFWFLSRVPFDEMTRAQFISTMMVFAIDVVAVLMVIHRTHKFYRCPRCNSFPSYGGVWTVNPERCGKCSAFLRG